MSLPYQFHLSTALSESLILLPPESVTGLLEPLVVVSSRAWEAPPLTVTGYVLAASHAVHIVGPGLSVAQVIACSGPASPQGGDLLLSRALNAERVAQWHAERPEWRLSSVVVKQPLEVGAAIFAETPSQWHLEQPFPGPGDPITRLKVVLSGNHREHALAVHSLHTYPHEGLAVRSIFTVHLAGEGVVAPA